MDDKLSRRDVLLTTAALGAFAFGAGAWSKRPPALACMNTSGLSPADLTVRTSLAYVDNSAELGKTCSNCQQFVPTVATKACGTCKVVKGPINPNGNCKAYLAKPA
jgi:hypothetical protein